jgi:hypothetical protein
MSELEEKEAKRDRLAKQLENCLGWFHRTKPPIDKNTCLKLRKELEEQQSEVDELTRRLKLSSLGIKD